MKQEAQKTTMAAQSETALPRDPARALQEMMQTIDTLRDIHAEETMALKAVDTKAFFDLHRRKIEILELFHPRFSEFIKRKNEIMKIYPDLKKLLDRKQAEFAKVTAENLDALSRMQRTADRLGQRIMRTARETASRDSVAYGAGGNMSHYRNKPVTMGLNESV